MGDGNDGGIITMAMAAVAKYMARWQRDHNAQRRNHDGRWRRRNGWQDGNAITMGARTGVAQWTAQWVADDRDGHVPWGSLPPHPSFFGAGRQRETTSSDSIELPRIFFYSVWYLVYRLCIVILRMHMDNMKTYQ